MNLGGSPKTKVETKELKLMFDDWSGKPTGAAGMNVLSKDQQSFNNTQNYFFSTKKEEVNDQHISKRIYDQKLYFQSAQNAIVKEKAHINEADRTFDSQKQNSSVSYQQNVDSTLNNYRSQNSDMNVSKQISMASIGRRRSPLRPDEQEKQELYEQLM